MSELLRQLAAMVVASRVWLLTLLISLHTTVACAQTPIHSWIVRVGEHQIGIVDFGDHTHINLGVTYFTVSYSGEAVLIAGVGICLVALAAILATARAVMHRNRFHST
ncbi:MAG: hypothetical protein AAGD11_06225 [Planctomycetota bacterium]